MSFLFQASERTLLGPIYSVTEALYLWKFTEQYQNGQVHARRNTNTYTQKDFLHAESINVDKKLAFHG